MGLSQRGRVVMREGWGVIYFGHQREGGVALLLSRLIAATDNISGEEVPLYFAGKMFRR